jgi:hypothetical protein
VVLKTLRDHNMLCRIYPLLCKCFGSITQLWPNLFHILLIPGFPPMACSNYLSKFHPRRHSTSTRTASMMLAVSFSCLEGDRMFEIQSPAALNSSRHCFSLLSIPAIVIICRSSNEYKSGTLVFGRTISATMRRE